MSTGVPMKAIILFITLFASIQAQLNALPNCAIACLGNSLQLTGCKPTDAKCICENPQLIPNITGCAAASCGRTELSTTANVATSVCRSVGITVAIPDQIQAIINGSASGASASAGISGSASMGIGASSTSRGASASASAAATTRASSGATTVLRDMPSLIITMGLALLGLGVLAL